MLKKETMDIIYGELNKLPQMIHETLKPSNTPRDESLPRVSELYHFLNEEEFNKIPQDQLDGAAERGNIGHKLIEQNWNTDLDNPIVNMFREGLEKIQGNRTMPEPQIEQQLNGETFTGKPDFRWGDTVIDYKFTRGQLRPETAIQLSLYAILLEEQTWGNIFNHFAFHFPPEHGGLFIYRIPDRAIEPLRKFGLSLVEHYDAIKEGRQIKYLKIAEWERLQREYEVFEPFCNNIMPPTQITTHDKAKQAALLYNTDIKRFEEQREIFKRELVRYMEEEGKDKIYDITGGGVHLRNHKATKVYDPVKKTKADKIYAKALEDALIETKPNKALYRFDAPKKKQDLLTD